MNTEAFIRAYHETRNGTDRFHQNPFYPSFVYSDGVAECAQAGCYWLLDILGTELPTQFKRRKPWDGFCIVRVKVKNESATILGEWMDDDPSPWRRKVNYTDMPEGEWLFQVSDMGDRYACILLTEY
jgi:hypothetical protein